METKILEIQGFSKTYTGSKKAVDNLSLCICAGDIYGFIGQNGAGKTTTIRAVAGVMDFEDGEIRITGRSVKTEPIICKSVTAYIPDNPDLYDFLTGIQYLGYIGDIFGVTRGEREERLKHYAELLGMTGSLGDLIGSYSHGMKQKTAIIGAFLHKPKLLVLDEPFVGLDPEASFRLKLLMRELCDEGGAIFFSTHVLDVAEKLCNKIAIIKAGRLVTCGSIDDVLKEAGGTKDGSARSLEQVFLEVSGYES